MKRFCLMIASVLLVGCSTTPVPPFIPEQRIAKQMIAVGGDITYDVLDATPSEYARIEKAFRRAPLRVQQHACPIRVIHPPYDHIQSGVAHTSNREPGYKLIICVRSDFLKPGYIRHELTHAAMYRMNCTNYEWSQRIRATYVGELWSEYIYGHFPKGGFLYAYSMFDWEEDAVRVVETCDRFLDFTPDPDYLDGKEHHALQEVVPEEAQLYIDRVEMVNG